MRGLLRAASLVSLLALLWAQLWGSVHLSTGVHATCPEHGELIDVPSGAAAVAQDRPHLSAPPERSLRGHDEHHCPFALHGHARPLTPVLAAVAPAPRAADVRRPLPDQPERLDRALILALAPKSSPPPTQA